MKKIDVDFRKVFSFSVKMFQLVLGAFLLASAMHIFMLPSKFIPGGISGITVIIQTICEFPASYTMIILNAPLIILSFIFLSKEFAIKSTLGIIMTSLFLQLFEVVKMFQFFNPNELWLSALAGGIIGGIGIGLMVRSGGSSGGTEIISLLVKKKVLSFSMSSIVFVINAIVVVLGSILYLTILKLPVTDVLTIGMCSFLQIFLGAKSLELVLNGLSSAVKFEIVTSKSAELKNCVVNDMKRSVTVLECKGGYTDETRDMVICLVTRVEINEFKKILKKIDPTAFVYAVNTREVIGNGFKDRQ